MRMKLNTVSFLLLLAQLSFAQVEIFGGANYAFVRHQYLPNAQPTFGSQWGFGMTINPKRDWQKFSVTGNIVLTMKGYEQWVNRTYRFELFYTGVQFLANYDLNDLIRLQTGIELVRLENSSVYNSVENYSSNDMGLMAGIELFHAKRVSGFIQGIYGLLPLIDYYDIDAAGNFNGRIRDVRNTCLSAGLKLKIYKHKYYVW